MLFGGTKSITWMMCVDVGLWAMQADRPAIVLSLRFSKGSITFIGLSTLASLNLHHTEALSAADIGVMSQQAGLPEKLQLVLSGEGVFLPKGVSRDMACSPRWFSLAHKHKVCAGFWVRNSSLAAILQRLLA